MTPNRYLYGDNQNSTNTALAAGAEWIGQPRNLADAGYPGVVVAMKTDATGTLYMEQSVDGVNWDSSLSFDVEPDLNEVHRITITRSWYRTRYVNGSTPQTYLRLQTNFDDPAILSTPLNSTLQQDGDSICVRSFPAELDIAAGRYEGTDIVNKFGRNTDISTNSVPEDLWNGGGVYTGFPTGAPEEFEVFSSSVSDTGVLTFTYLPSSTSTRYLTGTVTLNGTTPVATGITGYRMHTARYSTGAATTFNVGTITLRHRVTTANVFCVMPIGRSQTNVSAYTVPAGSTAYIRRLFMRVTGTTSLSIQGALWVRGLGESPRLRRPITATNAEHFEEEPYGGIPVAEGSDIVLRVTSSSNNNVDVTGGYDLVLIKNR
jgi:hypothetical protein